VASQYVATRLAKMLINKTSIKRHPGTLMRDTPYNDATYKFGFHTANYVARDEATDAMVQQAFGQLKEILEAPTVMVEAKIHLTDMFFVFARSNRSEGAFDFDRARKKFEARYSAEIKQLIASVVEHGLDQYLPEGGKCIYDYEENYFYAMYQLWSGNPNDAEGISKLRRVASYKLVQHPKIIESYWENRFQGNNNWIQNAELYLDIEDLIEITKQAGLTEKFQDRIDYWESTLNRKKEPLVAASLQEGFSTLHLQLSNLGYLTSDKS